MEKTKYIENKTRKNVMLRMEKTDYEKVKAYCEYEGRPIKTFMSMAIDEDLKERGY